LDLYDRPARRGWRAVCERDGFDVKAAIIFHQNVTAWLPDGATAGLRLAGGFAALCRMGILWRRNVFRGRKRGRWGDILLSRAYY